MDQNDGERVATASGAGTATATRDGGYRADTPVAGATTRIAATRADGAGPRAGARRRAGRGDDWIVAAVLAALFVLLLAASVDLVVAVAATAVVGIASQGLRGGRAPRS
jgi:hypothetical protein